MIERQPANEENLRTLTLQPAPDAPFSAGDFFTSEEHRGFDGGRLMANLTSPPYRL